MARPPILLMSTRRAGSTLLRLLLDTHPAVRGPGELSLGRLCDSLYTAVDATLGRLDAEETIDTRRVRCLDGTRRIVDRIMDEYCALGGKERWCEKAGEIDSLPLLLSVFPDATFVFLHRHCLDVVRSSIEMYGPYPPGMYIGERQLRGDGHLTAAWIDCWCEWTEKLLALEAQGASRAVRVRYEDLVRDPDAALRTILDCAGERWVAGLADRVFTMPHHLGGDDPKVILTPAIVTNRIGKGCELDLGGVPEQLLDRMRSLLAVLGYEQPRACPARADARGELTSVAELFDIHFRRRLARYNHRLESGASIIGIKVTGTESGMWTIRVDSTGAHLEAGAGAAAAAGCTVVFDAGDLLDAANRKLTVAELGNRIALEGDLLSFDRPFGERLMWTLLGEDIRPPLAASSGANVYEMLARTASGKPDAVAVTADGQQLTYATLMRAAHALALRLQAIGVAPESRVAIVLDRSFDLVVALVATLASGGAYVPVDIDAPAGRIAALLRDAGAACVITCKALRARVPDTDAPVLVIDDGASRADTASSGAARGIRAAGDSLCYVMYTSGTTGEPKGVAVSHAALANLLDSMRRRPGLTAADALLAVTPITFDIASLEILLPLVTGARLAIAPRHAAADGAGLAARLAREDISVLQATPTTWRLLLDANWRAPAGFRALCGGEALPGELARRAIAAAGEVWNCYGPTETTIWSTIACLRDPAEPIAIGEPLLNTSVHLLDRRLEAAPRGAVGELYLGGIGLARGYLGRPRLTAERFIPDAADGSHGQRVYNTGDLARYQPDGRLECLGRTDHQIKIRGYRIEPGEIEHVLGAHPLIASAVVRAWDHAAGDGLLAAYVVAHGGARVDPPVLREFVRERLPAYMVPAIIMELDTFPLTPHGKIDRKALPAPDRWRPASRGAHATPSTGIERAVAAVWRRVLGVEQVGLHDNFFDLGGNSLLFAEARLELRRLLDHEISIVDVYQYPTIALLSAYVSLEAAERPREVASAVASQAQRQRRALAARTRPGVGPEQASS